MAVSIDTVYQRVLAFANKEQRGYITPQEFNLFAGQVQMEILEQYFYDVNQFKRILGNQTDYSDMINNLEEKISLFEVYDQSAAISSANGNVNLSNSFPMLYRLGMVRVNYNSSSLKVAEQIQLNELNKYADSPLAAWSKKRPVYTRYNLGQNDNIRIYPNPQNPQDTVSISYIKKPYPPNWAYVVVNGKTLYNDNVSRDFELHSSEESELVYRILAYAGVSIQKQEITQVASQALGSQIQQEKQ
tara:strand:- start:875 stop:1609 length:735 start_codon:yes stop_codon:yes gene_type:complete